MRIAVYTDYAYRRDPAGVYAERAFVLFLGALAERMDELVVLGRLHPEPGRGPYPLPPAVSFVPLPFYRALSRPAPAARALAGSLRAFWSALGRVDAIWLLGPHPLAPAVAALAALRRRVLVLGVRQDFPRYIRSRHPGRRDLALASDALDGTFRALARRRPAIVVGPALAERYRRSRALLTLTVSLVRERDVAAGPTPWPADGEEVRVLHVGRLEAEKNPLLLADVLALLPRRWRLAVCGEGPLEAGLVRRAAELGVGDRLELLGYVPHDRLRAHQREADLFLHVSWTEGVPQVLLEAFAAGNPTVATDVGGVRSASGGAAVLVAPGDAGAVVAALLRLAADPEERARRAAAGLAQAREHTLERESERVAAFLSRHARRGAPRRGRAATPASATPSAPERRP